MMTIRKRRERRRARAEFAARAVEVVRERQRFELARGAELEAENAQLRRQLAEARDHARWLAGRVQALERMHDPSGARSAEASPAASPSETPAGASMTLRVAGEERP